MKVYTKTGDKGLTGLIGGKRVLKSDDHVEAYGTVDELNSYMGLLRDQVVTQQKSEQLIEIQNNLFVIGSLLAIDPENQKINLPELQSGMTDNLEKWIDEMDHSLPAMTNFVLPGGNVAVSFGHVARCVCRRAERQIVSLSQQSSISDDILIYMNRLSDYLFVLCRWMSKELNIEEVIWKP